MTEIEQMYQNAGVLKECLSPCYINKTWRKLYDCPNCDKRTNYPPFTAEKQLELIKNIVPSYPINYKTGLFKGHSFEDGLAGVIANLWAHECLTEKEKKTIKRILEE